MICQTVSIHHIKMQAILSDWEEKEHERQSTLSSAAGGSRQAEAEEQQFVSYVALPDNKAIELRVLEKKKRDLLAKYATEAFQSQQDEAKSLLNKK